ncbi:CDP-diglyceride synthetase [Candidatus Pantoea edessiphila]|uniref:Phosphatidate cytidylyltransferase n=1 Tax=Candidatus Pantoea edessiphila TaxID=2044610 RepID=A0A2P5SY05_9GAMM|nr:phosphatidate cytidylyltransferase [Candidatus Pantoea edessiphila]MBK4775563.1 phosphatidate cytidylyltransferase [Pantoea sp. Edef]PPI87216.1 CDP-diglyceride synthetase [Candidatus Pantoea edessiphila]
MVDCCRILPNRKGVSVLKNRFFAALILIVFIIFAVFLLSPLNFELIVLAVCVLAAWEWSNLSGIILLYQRVIMSILFGFILFVLMLFLNIYKYNIYSLIVTTLLWISLTWWIIALFLVLTYPLSSFLWNNSNLIRAVFGILTLIPFFYILAVFRCLNYDKNQFIGSWWILYIIFLVCCIDSSAYFFGNVFGKNKLAPIISPNKTWEGFAFSLIFSFLINLLFFKLKILDFSKKHLVIFSIVITFASLLGDLTESMMKREIGIKDSSNIIPGHGGILDRIDSLTTVVPVFSLFMVFYLK